MAHNHLQSSFPWVTNQQIEMHNNDMICVFVFSIYAEVEHYFLMNGGSSMLTKGQCWKKYSKVLKYSITSKSRDFKILIK